MMPKTILSRLKQGLVLFFSASLIFANFSAYAGDIVTYIHTDRLGNPVAKTNSVGAVIWRQSYTPYGEADRQSEQDGPGYTGHRYDASTGLVYMQARYYDPKIGRFLSVDPVTFTPQNPKYFNRYWYAAGNPYKYTDPDGRCLEDLCIGEGAAAGCALTGPACPAGAVVGGIIGFVGGTIGAIIVYHKLNDEEESAPNKPDSEAADNRAKNKKKGVPDSKLGPSGKPKRHNVDHATPKRAKDAARAESGNGGSSEKHANPTKGSPHYHSKDRAGNKGRIHHNYPDKRKKDL